MTRVRAVTLLVTLAFFVTGAFVSAAAAGELSKDDYLIAADNICRQVNVLDQEAQAENFAGTPPDEDPSLEQLTAYVADIEPNIEQELDSLRALPAPKGDKKRLKKIYKLVEKGFAKIVDDPAVLLDGPNPLAKAGKAAQKYGFKVCGAAA